MDRLTDYINAETLAPLLLQGDAIETLRTMPSDSIIEEESMGYGTKMGISINEIKTLETLFSDNQYNGSGSEAFIIEKGTIPVMISAPHAVNQYRDGKMKWADMYTGGIARYLHRATGCHLICSCMFTKADPNYDPPGENPYQDALRDYLNNNRVRLLIDLHGSARGREYAVEMGTAPERDQASGAYREEDPSLHEHPFVAPKIKEILEKNFRDLTTDRREIWKNRMFGAGDQNTVTKFISGNTDVACIQLEINGIYRDPENEKEFSALVASLTEIIEYFAFCDW